MAAVAAAAAPRPFHHDQFHDQYSKHSICRYWLQQRCTRRACPFAHPAAPARAPQFSPPKAHTFTSRSWRRRPACINSPAALPDVPAAAAEDCKCRSLAEAPPQHQPCRHATQQVPSPPCRKLKRCSSDTVNALPVQADPHHQHSKAIFTSCIEEPLKKNACTPVHTDLARPKQQFLAPAPALLEQADTTGYKQTNTCSSGTLALSIHDHETHQIDLLAPMLVGTFKLAGINHEAAIRGMALPLSSDTLFTIGGNDATLSAWKTTSTSAGTDYHFSLGNQLQLPDRPHCLFHSFCDPDWLFVGLNHEVRVCNLRTHSQHSLSVSSPVLSMASLGNLLLAGLEEGSILVWRFDSLSSSFEVLVSLSTTGHRDDMSKLSPVLTLEPCLGSTIVYAGLANGTIQVWDVATAFCCHVLSGAHSKAVTHLLACDPLCALLSASQDGSIKLWTICSNHWLELHNTLDSDPKPAADASRACTDDAAIVPLALCGVLDGSTNTPVLFASYSNSQVHILDLRTLARIGTIITNDPISAMDTGSSHLLVLGSTAGELSAWKWKQY
ncbi:hypothetical protein GOP47_0008872 [Adiantum capillus-veneris]|uniref:C3H1-type domain-containing protein n=1 Tax=Adiantum capillus-veneris TaxID=13818 RepID=A0A9D4ZK47_ADICA|nr:hypothetical protein GOP47_0008872 [Adiantum capillus-veneris]